MAINLVDPKSGAVYQAPDTETARAQMHAYGLDVANDEQVQAYDAQKRSGTLAGQLATVPETAAATLSDTVGGVATALTGGKVIEKGGEAYSDAAKERRAVNPNAALVGAAIPDIAAMALVPEAEGAGAIGKGLSWAGRAVTSGLTAEGGETAIQGDDFSLGDAAMYGLAAGALEAGGHYAFSKAAKALGAARDGLDGAVERASRGAVRDATTEPDAALKAAKMADPDVQAQLFQKHQVGLDEALDGIDQRMSSASERMFSPSALKKSVSDNAAAQADQFLELSVQLQHAADVGAHPDVEAALGLMRDKLEGSGPDMFRAMRDARAALEKIDTDSPLIKEAYQSLDDALRNHNTWGKAAQNYAATADTSAAREAAQNAASRFRVDDMASRTTVEAKLDAAQSMAGATGDKRLSNWVAQARKSLADADELTGARVMQDATRGRAANMAGRLWNRAAKYGDELGAEVVQDKIDSLFKAGGVALGSTIGGMPGGIAGYLGGRELSKRYSARISEQLWKAMKVTAKYAEQSSQRAAGKVAMSAEQMASDAATRAVKNIGAKGKDAETIWKAARDAAFNHFKANPVTTAGAVGLAAAAPFLDEQDAQGTAGAGVGALGAAGLLLAAPKLGMWKVGRELVNLDHVANPIAHLTEMGAKPSLIKKVEARIAAAAKPLTGEAVSSETHAAMAARNEALWSDAEKRAISDYQGEDYREINDALRSGSTEGAEHAQHVVTALDKAVAAGNVAPGTLWRGVDLSEKELEKLKQSSELMAHGVLSGATNPERAQIFAPGELGNKRVLFKIEQQTAVPVSESGEEELLMRPGTKYEVVNVDRQRYEGGPYSRGPNDFSYIDTVELRETGQVEPKRRKAFLREHGGKLAAAGLAGGGLMALGSEADAAEPDADGPAPGGGAQLGADLGTHPELDQAGNVLQTRDKLDYLKQRSEVAMNTTARALASPQAAQRAVPRRPGVSNSSGVQTFMGSQDTLHAAFEEKRSSLQKLQQDPMILVNELADSLGGLQDAAPDLHRKVVAQTYKVAQYLQDKMPGTIGASLTRPEGSPVSGLAVRQFALYYSAATDPSTVLADLTHNRAQHEQVDTLRELWPETYDKLKGQIVDQMSKTRPSVAQRQRLDLLFDFGDTLDTALSSRLVAFHDEWKQSPQGQDKLDPSGKPKAPPQMPTRRTNPSIEAVGALGSLSQGATGIAA